MKWIAILSLCISLSAYAQATKPSLPIAPDVKVKTITSKDMGPDIDPKALAGSKFNGFGVGGSFDSFVSSCYAFANVWVYAAEDSKEIYRSRFDWTYPKFYQPTWGEVFDMVARQTKCKWSFDPKNRQFKFEPNTREPSFGVTLADGWRREDRGAYIWHAPKDLEFGMDIYDYGQFTIAKGDGDLPKKIREYFAVANISDWPNPPTVDQMSITKVGETDALYLKIDTPRPGGVWRQWSMVIEGHAYLIVSAMPKEREKELVPAIEQMVQTFKTTAPAAQPAR
jgi:hypothetical protein